MLVAPAMGGRNEIARFKVKMVPAAETLDPAPFRTHWLFSCVPLPGVIDPAGRLFAKLLGAGRDRQGAILSDAQLTAAEIPYTDGRRIRPWRHYELGFQVSAVGPVNHVDSRIKASIYDSPIQGLRQQPSVLRPSQEIRHSGEAAHGFGPGSVGGPLELHAKGVSRHAKQHFAGREIGGQGRNCEFFTLTY